MDLVSYVYDTGSRNLDESQKRDTGGRLVEPLNLSICGPLLNVTLQSELENVNHDMFGTNEIDDICISVEKLEKLSGRGNMFQFTL